MKKYISLIFGVFLLSLAACTEEIENPNDNIDNVNKIILSVKPSGTTVTRSADTDAESALALIDVYIMDEDYDMVYQERLDNTASPAIGGGDFTLKKNRDEFEAGKKYFVYIVANSTLDMADDWTELKSLTQRNSNVHLSGMNIVEVASGDMPPKYFLMDGFAYVGDDEPEDMAAYVINDTRTDDTVLNATLYRAAAKIIVNITQGESVEFHKVLDDAGPLYSFYQLPISTLVVNPSVSGARHTSDKQTTIEWGLSQNNFHWTTDDNDEPVITYVGYAYANDWSNNNPTNETALLFSIPMMWDADGNGSKEKSSPVNWYKVPVSKTNKFERNKCYVLNVNINAVGAEEKNVPVELRDIEYVTLDWEDVEVEIGENIAKYLTLNTDFVKIYDSNFDLDQLTFTSSSPIKSIKLKDVFGHNESMKGADAFYALAVTKESDGTTEAEYETGDGVYAYYIDKFGQKIQLGEDPKFDLKLTDLPELTKEEILQLEKNLYENIDSDEQHIRAVVPDEYKRALNGDIHIYSPIYPVEGDEELNWNSHFNTIRYLEFEVMNEQGLTATFRVEQYPLSVITNEEGFYSFRDDHVLTDDPNEKPFDYFRYDLDFKSVMTSSMYLVHPHDFTEEPRPSEEVWARTPEMHLVRPEDFKGEPDETYWNTPQQDRRYAWLKNAEGDYSWLFDPTNTCPAQGTIGETWVEIRYGFYANTITYNNGKNTKTFQGIHRPRIEDRPYSDYFYRDMYRELPGELAITNKSYKGTGLGPYYKMEVLDKDGNKQTRIFRDHYRWNAQPVFWSKFVHKYYSEPAQGATYVYQNGSKSVFKQKGQVDMYEYGPSEDGGKTWGRYTYSTNLYKFSNHRMYNIWTTATSEDFVLGYPRYNEEGGTENTVYNSTVVSPTLTLASQLGETNYQQFLNNASYYDYIIPDIKELYRVAERHCREYVETTFIDKPDADGEYNHMWDEGEEIIEYRDWRLPTKAEIEMLIEFQSNSRAMDRVLDAQYYYCITGTADSDDLSNIDNWVSREIPGYDASTSKGYYIRCVRDAGRK